MIATNKVDRMIQPARIEINKVIMITSCNQLIHDQIIIYRFQINQITDKF